MLRRLATLALSLSLATTAFTATADARGFASAPSAPGAPMPVDDEARPPDDLPELRTELRRPTPRLSEATRARLQKILARRRAKNVAAFRAYARRGVYPHNFITDGPLNVWIDGDGHMCAAATMIFRSGYKKLVRQTARDTNYIRLADVTEGPLLDWILTSGLTQDEVAAIQLPFVGGPQPGRPTEQPPEDWRIAEDRRLRAGYEVVLTQLATDRAASLDAALDALAYHPELVAQLLKAR